MRGIIVSRGSGVQDYLQARCCSSINSTESFRFSRGNSNNWSVDATSRLTERGVGGCELAKLEA